MGILHIGNLKFTANDEGYVVYNADYNQLSHKAISSLLGIDADSLIESFTSSSPLGKNEFKRQYTLDATLDARDACSKYIYAKLFTWIIAKVNQTLFYEEIRSTKSKVKKIGNQQKNLILFYY
jgi:myosin heavy subunit